MNILDRLVLSLALFSFGVIFGASAVSLIVDPNKGLMWFTLVGGFLSGGVVFNTLVGKWNE